MCGPCVYTCIFVLAYEAAYLPVPCIRKITNMQMAQRGRQCDKYPVTPGRTKRFEAKGTCMLVRACALTTPTPCDGDIPLFQVSPGAPILSLHLIRKIRITPGHCFFNLMH